MFFKSNNEANMQIAANTPDTTTTTPRHVRASEAAEMLGVHIQTLRTNVARVPGHPQPFRLGSGRTSPARFWLADINAYIANLGG